MPQGAYPLIEIPDSYNPRYGANLPYLPPEQQMLMAPVQGSAGPSVPVPAAEAPAPSEPKKKRGILGTIGKVLENVFMPEPDSLYAAALRGGIWDAKVNQQQYLHEQELQDIERTEANRKLMESMNSPKVQIAGNNLVVTPPGGGEPRFIQPSPQPSEAERLIDKWQNEPDPAKRELIRQYILKSNDPTVLAAREMVARIRGQATTGAAQIRANAPPRSSGVNAGKPGVKLPSGAVIIK